MILNLDWNIKTNIDILILGILGILFIPHIARIPIWISIFCLTVWTYAFFCHLKQKKMPPRKLIIFITLVCIVGLAFTYGYAIGRNAGVGLLCLMLGLKPLEIKNDRDRKITVFLCYFLIITNLLYSQSLVMAGYLVLSVILTSSLLIQIGHDSDFVFCFKKSGTIFLQALPLATLLFLLFPRISGSLWGFQDKSSIGITGLNDSLEPGLISSLAMSSNVAFRVKFINNIPPKDMLYWRAMTLSKFDGKKWTSTDIKWLKKIPVQSQPESNSIRYTITMEAHDQPWMFALDLPESVPSKSGYFNDFTIQARRNIKKRLRYELTSCEQCQTKNLIPLQNFLTLPSQVAPKARDLALNWRKSGLNSEQIVAKAMNFFYKERFYYTLRPPLLDMTNPIDDFLFKSRKGYCEHYASAFVFLMRAANIPARIVIGYQGGEINPVGKYLIVRQSNAHAWAEVWLKGQWTRIDPTTAIAPERVEQGINELLENQNKRVPILGIPTFGLLKKISLNWDALNNFWNQWVLDYSAQKQSKLFSSLGLQKNWKGMSTAIMLVMGSVIACGLFILLYLTYYSHKQQDRIYNAYVKFLKKTKKYPRYNLTPVEYIENLIISLPNYAESLKKIKTYYIKLRYMPLKNKEYKNLIINFENCISKLKIK